MFQDTIRHKMSPKVSGNKINTVIKYLLPIPHKMSTSAARLLDSFIMHGYNNISKKKNIYKAISQPGLHTHHHTITPSNNQCVPYIRPNFNTITHQPFISDLLLLYLSSMKECLIFLDGISEEKFTILLIR